MSYWETKCHFCPFKIPFIALQGYLNCKKSGQLNMVKNKQTKLLAPSQLKYTFPYIKCYTWNPKKYYFSTTQFLTSFSSVPVSAHLQWACIPSCLLCAGHHQLLLKPCQPSSLRLNVWSTSAGTSLAHPFLGISSCCQQLGVWGENGSYAKHVADSAAPPCVWSTIVLVKCCCVDVCCE